MAAALLEKAAAKGIADAAFDLGVSCERGHGVPKDVRRAFRLYVKAARLGDRQAEYEIGRFYYWGIGVKMDRKRAEHWFARARRHRVPEALSEGAVRQAVGARGRR